MNERPTHSMPKNAWPRPANVRSSPYDQPWDRSLAADVSLRDGRWKTGSHEDLWALAACALTFAALAFAIAALAG